MTAADTQSRRRYALSALVPVWGVLIAWQFGTSLVLRSRGLPQPRHESGGNETTRPSSIG